jgi:predicted RNase H-like HicB family nuclease
MMGPTRLYTKVYYAYFEYTDGESGYGVMFHDLPGLATAGDTFDEAYQMAYDGLLSHIQFLRKEGDPVPEPSIYDAIKDESFEKSDGGFLIIPIPFIDTSTFKLSFRHSFK